ncbi:MAG: transglutaminase domain-containing protein [Clostridiales bacterium]|nr:transglutaminase domain-containing protein [Clostridiales bacterium]
MIGNDHLKHMNVPLPEEIASAATMGDLSLTQTLIDGWLRRDIPQALRMRLETERLFQERLRQEYTLTEDSLLSSMAELVPDFTPDDLQALLIDGWLDTRLIDGTRHFMDDVPASLVKANPDIARRAGKPLVPEDKLLDGFITRVKAQRQAVLALHMKASLRVREEAFVPGTLYRAHLPLPKPAAQQRDAQIIDCSPVPKHIARESAPQRTAYFEETLATNAPFSAEYAYTWRCVYADPTDGKPFIVYPDAAPPTGDDLKEHLPHIAFTPYLKALAAELKGDEIIPMRIAKRYYDFITSHVRYAYVRPYQLIDNGAEYAAVNLRGDCGLQALLFIALCRISGIPARWESGLIARPGHVGCHDWAQFYTESWGWLPVDCSFGGAAYRKGSPERRRYYFGNIDPWRMAANSGYMMPFQPPKRHLRADPYDNQRGEVETDEKGLTSSSFRASWEMLGCDFVLP